MNRQFSKIISLLWLTSFAVFWSGCKTTCHSNLKAGLATIICQPEDMVIHDINSPAKFKVTACGHGLEYRWYRNIGNTDFPLDETDEKRGLASGVFTPELTIKGPWLEENAQYYCVISSINRQGDAVYTETRTAYFTSNPTIQLIRMNTTTVRANLPKPGGPQNISTFKYCSLTPLLTAVPPTNGPFASCSIKLTVVDPPSTGASVDYPVERYYLKVLDGNGVWVNVNQGAAGTLQKTFNLSTPPYALKSYCDCSFPTDSPNLIFTLTWQ
jgi:hypothetical protein